MNASFVAPFDVVEKMTGSPPPVQGFLESLGWFLKVEVVVRGRLRPAQRRASVDANYEETPPHPPSPRDRSRDAGEAMASPKNGHALDHVTPSCWHKRASVASKAATTCPAR